MTLSLTSNSKGFSLISRVREKLLSSEMLQMFLLKKVQFELFWAKLKFFLDLPILLTEIIFILMDSFLVLNGNN